MLSRLHRFHGHNSVRVAYRQGKTVRSTYGSLHYHVSDRRRRYRLAVVVSKKVSKSAVVRNRIRRRLYEAVRLQEAAITKPYDLVLTVHGEQLATMPHAELTAVVHGLLKQAGILQAGQPEA